MSYRISQMLRGLRPREEAEAANVTTHSRFNRSVVYGDAYRVSKTAELDNGEELILHISNPPTSEWDDDPVDVNIEPIGIKAERGGDINAWKNADPGAGFAGDSPILGNLNYAYSPTPSEPVTIEVDADGDFETDFTKETGLPDDGQTEEDFLPEGGSDVFGQSSVASPRGLYRIIPPSESITVVIRNTEGGSRTFGFETSIYLANLGYEGEDSTTRTEGY